jgi:membrane protease YdiL (CAAX protease family)
MSSILGLSVFLGWIGLWVPVALAVAWFANIPRRYPVAPEHKLPLLLPLYLLAPVAVEIYRRYGNGNAWASYGVAWQASTFQSLALGIGVAILGVALLVVSQLTLGWRQWRPRAEGVNQPPAPPPLLFLALPLLTLFIGWVEELIFRGVLVNGLLPALPWVVVAILASAIFAVSHLVWDGPSGIPSLPGLGLMGGVLLLARWVMVGDLSLAWGLHTGWIFAIALLDALQLTQPSPTAPGLAGKPDQPLTGLPALGLMVLTGLGLWGYTLWR